MEQESLAEPFEPSLVPEEAVLQSRVLEPTTTTGDSPQQERTVPQCDEPDYQSEFCVLTMAS